MQPRNHRTVEVDSTNPIDEKQQSLASDTIKTGYDEIESNARRADLITYKKCDMHPIII